MKATAIGNSIFRGDVVKRGTVVELTDEEWNDPVVRAHFAADPSVPAEPEPEQRPSAQRKPPAVVAGLTREQAVAKLREAGVAVKGNATNAAIAELFDNTFATVAEATRR